MPKCFFFFFFTFTATLCLSQDHWQDLQPQKIDQVDRDSWYLISKKQLTEKAVVIRELDDKWVIGKPASRTDVRGVYEINDHWKWSNKLRFPTPLEKEITRRYTLSFSQPLNQIPKGAYYVEDQKALVIEANYKTIEKLWLNHPNLIWIDLHQSPKEESILRRHDLSVNDIYYAHHLHGKQYGVSTSIKEQRFRVEDLDISGISDTTERSYPVISSHATDMATLVSGKGVSYLFGTGVSQSPLISTSFDLLFPEPSDYFSSYQCRVQNHSYGVGVENYYGAEARAYDQASASEQEVLHVFSSGNSGDFTALEGQYKGLLATANLTGTFKQAKNVLVVGATDSLKRIKYYSSVGPTYDGRIKPELVAYGGEGSSDAAALVSGMASYLMGYAVENMGVNLTAQETKAILIAAAEDTDTPGPDYQTGFGSASLSNSIDILSKDQYLSNALSSSSNTHEIQIPENIRQLQIVLYWHDAPALIDAPRALTHDLDLTVLTPNNEVVYPWVLSTYPHKDSLSSTSKRGVDRINNVEYVSIDNPVSGTYAIEISSLQAADQAKAYSIAYNKIEKDTFHWTFPTSSDHVIASEQTLIRWKSGYENVEGKLYWQSDAEEILLIHSAVNLTKNQLVVEAPARVGKGNWIMEIDGVDYITDQVWIEAVPELNIYLNCEEEVVFQWENQNLASASKLFNPETQITPPNYTDSIFAFAPGLLQSEFVALRHLYEEKEGIRSYAINYTQQGAGCYLKSFLLRSPEENSVTLEVILNGIDLIQEVSIEKKTARSVETLFTLNEISDSIIWTDVDLEPGIIDYRVRLTKNNGNTIYSDWQTLFYTDDDTHIMFPNPVSPSGELSLISNATGGIIQITDTNGSIILEWPIVNTIENIPLYNFRQGLYLYRVIDEKKILSTGKIMIK